MSEPLTILREYLLDPVAVGPGGVNLLAELGGAYVSTPVAPAGFKNLHPAIIYHEETGTSHVTDSTRQAVVVCKCYGGSMKYEDARGVRETLHAYLHNARGINTASGRIALAVESARIQGPPEPETGWPVAIAKYTVTTE